MNFDVLYPIAIDLINKKRANNWNFSSSDFVCILMTDNNNIFSGMSVSEIKNGKLVSSCAEYETIKIMMGSNETKIKALATVNVSSLMPSLPCDDCKKLILEINPENSHCMIMKPDNSFCALKDICASTNTINNMNNPNSTDDWDVGWDDDVSNDNNANINTNVNLDAFTPTTNANTYNINFNMNGHFDNPIPNAPVTPNVMNMGNASVYTSRYINPIPNSPVTPNMMNNQSMYTSRYINPMPNTPINQPVTNMSNTSTFQTISMGFNPLSYQQPSNMQNQMTSFENHSSTQGNNTTASKSSSIFKQRLRSIMLDDDITDIEESSKDFESPKTSITDTDIENNKFFNKHNKITSDKSLKSNSKIDSKTKKELKAIAKEKKRQAKKNYKILESMEKQSKS